MIARGLLLICVSQLLPIPAAGDEAVAVFDHLPAVAYDGEALTVALRASAGRTTSRWRVVEPPAEMQLSRSERDAVLQITFVPRLARSVRVVDASDALVAGLHFVRPGSQAPLELGDHGRLHFADLPVVLLLERREAEADRRWALLRGISEKERPRCDLILPAPTVPFGHPVLLAQIHAARRRPTVGRSIMVQLGGDDVFASWKHRAYRQALAWLVSDLKQRGALRVVLVQPVAPDDGSGALGPLQEQVVDVGRTYDCEVIAQPGLEAPAAWAVAPGVIGPDLAPEALRRYRQRCAAELAPGVDMPAP
ncbi:MAG: hypothetical protein ACOCZK_02015 [Planctomycetota bacterium]